MKTRDYPEAWRTGLKGREDTRSKPLTPNLPWEEVSVHCVKRCLGFSSCCCDKIPQPKALFQLLAHASRQGGQDGGRGLGEADHISAVIRKQRDQRILLLSSTSINIISKTALCERARGPLTGEAPSVKMPTDTDHHNSQTSSCQYKPINLLTES